MAVCPNGLHVTRALACCPTWHHWNILFVLCLKCEGNGREKIRMRKCSHVSVSVDSASAGFGYIAGAAEMDVGLRKSERDQWLVPPWACLPAPFLWRHCLSPPLPVGPLLPRHPQKKHPCGLARLAHLSRHQHPWHCPRAASLTPPFGQMLVCRWLSPTAWFLGWSIERRGTH